MTTKGSRGKPPSLNKSQSKKKRREVIIKASMDVYRVENARYQALEQLARFLEMSKGSDGGQLREGHDATVREMHFAGWKDTDFRTLYNALNKAIKTYNKEHGITLDSKGPYVDHDNQ